jgi:hypothetical protein
VGFGEWKAGSARSRHGGVERLTVRDLQFKRSHELTTQGTVLEVGKGFVSLQISSDFPGLDLIFDNTSSSGR